MICAYGDSHQYIAGKQFKFYFLYLHFIYYFILFFYYFILDVYSSERKYEKALIYYKKATEIYRIVDSEKSNYYEKNGWAIIRNNDAVCLVKYAKLLSESFSIDNGITAAFASGRARKLMKQRDYILKNREVDFKIIFNENLLW